MVWWREIPLIKQFLELMIHDTYFQTVALSYLVVGVLFLVLMKGHKFPYGKLYVCLDPKLSKRLKMLPTKLGLFITHFPSLVTFTYVSLYYPNSNFYSLPCYLYIGMMVYRCFIYPWFRKPSATKIPVRTVAMLSISGFFQALISARCYAFSPSILKPVQIYVLSGLFILTGIAIIYCDFVVCRARGLNRPKECLSKDPVKIEEHKKEVEKAEKDGSYKVITKPLFKKVVCPQYAFQFAQWCIWQFFVSDPLYYSVTVWMYYLFIVRADDQKALLFQIYARTPLARYVYELKPALPFLTNSRFFLKIMMRGYI